MHVSINKWNMVHFVCNQSLKHMATLSEKTEIKHVKNT